jgi:hypothetical protein
VLLICGVAMWDKAPVFAVMLVQDFQAVSAGTRFVLEACVDLVLINHDYIGNLSIKCLTGRHQRRFR